MRLLTPILVRHSPFASVSEYIGRKDSIHSGCLSYSVRERCQGDQDCNCLLGTFFYRPQRFDGPLSIVIIDPDIL